MDFKYSVIIPVYNNEETIELLFKELESVSSELNDDFEVIFINDSSPDASILKILKCKNSSNLKVRIINHSRNFGSFAAVRTGLMYSRADFTGVISADLQEPPSLLLSFFRRLEASGADIVFGTRTMRSDPIFSRIASKLYWFLYRKLINTDIPKNGIDVFACRKSVTGSINEMRELNSSLIGMLFWVGFRREFEPYERMPRLQGKSSWTLRRKFIYMSDSVFAFSDYPIRFVRALGFGGFVCALAISVILLSASLAGEVDVPGYVPIMLAILFGNSSVLISLGVLGSYLWRTFQNTQMRPFSIIRATDGKEEGH